MFTTLIVKPIFNLLVLIYGILPGHNFGLALIIFTVIIRLLLWPLIKRQLHQTKLMRKLQPDIKRIKKETKGNRQKEMAMTMELYKEKGFSPYASFPTLIVQFIVLIGLYSGIQKVIHDPHNLITFAYPSLQHLPWMKELANNIHLFDNTLFGIVNLSKAAVGSYGIYWPAMIIVAASAVTQYFQSKQLLPNDKDSRGLRQILKDSGKGPQPDQSEVNAAVGRSTIYLLPVMIFVITVRFASALSLYWFVGGLVAYIQQSIILKDDETELETMGDKPSKKDVSSIPEAEVIETTSSKPKTKKKKSKGASKRRKR